uniref:Uncharacterized protein n=1 Tax=Nelumbo nucifera TaxID=4432 RepID=A0A822ZNC2_NELNU|nr:TPA_asm: hypothetical protein HUJ06_016334 [Nelumbo nucifera]
MWWQVKVHGLSILHAPFIYQRRKFFNAILFFPYLVPNS